MGNFARVLHHLDMKDVKKRHLKELAARKIKEEQDKKEEKVIQEIAKKYKSDWRKELEEDFTVIPSGPTNSVSQTFQHVSGQNFSFSGLGGQETHPSTVTVFGDGVPAPNYNQLALAGYAKPLGNVLNRKKLEDTNSKLDASQEFAQKVGADVMMNARVKDSISSALSDDLGYKSTEDILAEVGDQWTYPEYMAMLDAIADRAAAAEEPIAKEIAEYSPTGSKTGDVPMSLINAQTAITNARNKAEQALHDAWERYNKIPEPQDGFGGGQGNPTNRRGSGFDTEGELDDSGYGMDPDRDTETEARPEKEDEFRKARVNRRGPSVGNTGISENDADILISGASKFSKELQVFFQYLFNKGPKVIDNNHLGRNHVLKLFKDGFINNNGKFAVDDFIVGSGQKLTFNQKTGLYSVKFTYDFDDNATEIFKDPEKYRFMPGIHPKNFFLNARVILGGNYGLDGLGVPGRLIEIAKAFGGGKSKPGEITISHEDLLKQNPSLVQQTGSVWNQSMMGTPKGSDPEVTHNYYAVYGKLPPRAVVKGSVPYNYGDYPEYDPKVIDRIKSEKRSSKTQTKEPSKSKTVGRIKSMTKARNQSMSLDEPIVRRKKKRG